MRKDAIDAKSAKFDKVEFSSLLRLPRHGFNQVAQRDAGHASAKTHETEGETRKLDYDAGPQGSSTPFALTVAGDECEGRATHIHIALRAIRSADVRIR